jgi:hypothetical protein
MHALFAAAHVDVGVGLSAEVQVVERACARADMFVRGGLQVCPRGQPPTLTPLSGHYPQMHAAHAWWGGQSGPAERDRPLIFLCYTGLVAQSAMGPQEQH